jgi:hypothetical protein
MRLFSRPRIGTRHSGASGASIARHFRSLRTSHALPRCAISSSSGSAGILSTSRKQNLPQNQPGTSAEVVMPNSFRLLRLPSRVPPPGCHHQRPGNRPAISDAAPLQSEPRTALRVRAGPSPCVFFPPTAAGSSVSHTSSGKMPGRCASFPASPEAPSPASTIPNTALSAIPVFVSARTSREKT